MRRGYNDVGILSDDHGQVIGICFGWDHTAEHEWGIRGILSAFGIPGMPERRPGNTVGDLIGADTRAVTKVPAELKLFGFKKAAYLVYSSAFAWRDPPPATEKELDQLLDLSSVDDDKEIVASWSGEDFGIRIKNGSSKKGLIVLRQINTALQIKDALICLAGPGGPFRNRGLHILIHSRLPQEMFTLMHDADASYLDLTEAAVKTGIRARVDAAKKGYFALSPRWVDEEEKPKTKHPVIFWLNPEQQHSNNYGWFTVEELDQWIAGKGPIPKN